MAWEKRERGGRYYTRSKRVNGRVVREYVGKGPLGELKARQDEQRREEQLTERLELQELREEAKQVTDALKELEAACDEAIGQTLTDEGFHEHKGQWRRRRKA